MAEAGVDRIMVDLEINGKEARQGHLDTVVSRHSMHDISAIRIALDSCGCGELMVRVNPLYAGSADEIDEVLARGADRIMLPMFSHPDDVSECLCLVAGRAPVTLLLETSAALARLPRILSVEGLDDIHIGLNDLHLDMGLDFMFELFGSGLLDHAADLIHGAGLRYGIGGVSCIGSGLLPAELILGAHLHLGSERVFLSRSFTRLLAQGLSAAGEIKKLRDYLAKDDLNLQAMRDELNSRAWKIAAENRAKRSA